VSSTASIAVFAVLDLAVISALAAVCRLPFRLGRRPRAGTVIRLPEDRLEPRRWAA
jgi:hypothetical protein